MMGLSTNLFGVDRIINTGVASSLDAAPPLPDI